MTSTNRLTLNTLAELLRILRRGGSRLPLLLSVIVPVATAVLWALFISDTEGGDSSLAVTSPIQLAGFLATLGASFSLTLNLAKSAESTAVTSLLVIRERHTVFWSILSGQAAAASLPILLAGLITTPIAMVVNGTLDDLHDALTAFTASAVAGVLFSVLTLALGILVRKSVWVIVTHLFLVYISPLALMASIVLPLPEFLTEHVLGAVERLPAALLIVANTTGVTEGSHRPLIAMGGLAVWASVATLAALRSFNRRDF
ncbi:hypothetical protein [Falsarthrobacter nasiphocae]|uniref:Uncharacterized protein n=1 Tax=Falsarthrobacter nasiphocae TaxID=189863 RepID=A0AAE3YFX9_9MICC|nr:hypothetical protein [Falsarthrobacter nasiphocae]MDR6891296.1 hypothetical protein [Falsarthrobacter nasiphocae]